MRGPFLKSLDGRDVSTPAVRPMHYQCGEVDVSEMSKEQGPGRKIWITLAAFLVLSAFMYGSIMYKIIHYGP